jgi:hypothetical protein
MLLGLGRASEVNGERTSLSGGGTSETSMLRTEELSSVMSRYPFSKGR